MILTLRPKPSRLTPTSTPPSALPHCALRHRNARTEFFFCRICVDAAHRETPGEPLVFHVIAYRSANPSAKKPNRRIKTNAGIITKTSSSRLVGGTSFGYGVFFSSSFNRCARRASAGSDKEVSLLTAHCCCYYDRCIHVCLFKTRCTAWIHSCVLCTRRCWCVAVAGGCVAVLALQLCASDPVRRCVFLPFFLCTTLTGGIRCQSPLTVTPCHKCRAIAPLMSLTHSL